MLLRLAGPLPAIRAGSRGRRGPPARHMPALPPLPPPLSARLPDPLAPAQRRSHRSCTHFDEPLPHRPPEPRFSPYCPFAEFVVVQIISACALRRVCRGVRRTCLTDPPAPPARIPWRCAGARHDETHFGCTTDGAQATSPQGRTLARPRRSTTYIIVTGPNTCGSSTRHRGPLGALC